MKHRILALGFASCLLVPLPAGGETPLARHMGAFNDLYKSIRKETNTAKGAALAREAQREIVKAMSETPELVAEMPEGPQKARAAAEFRKMIGRVFVALCEMETAFLDGDTARVSDIVTALKDLKKAGHGKFMKDE